MHIQIYKQSHYNSLSVHTQIFKRLREFYDIDALSYMHSVCGDYNYLEFISNSKVCSKSHTH
ncbi:hypothetical protein EON63_24085 [archaeon]|nr:MAG: hypothetical protein EON63_24085 [archaeon]